jgi:vanillate O-demethylase monooxygenase subunit
MDHDVLSQYWHPVAVSNELSDAPVGVRLLDHELVLYKAGARIVAFKDLCIHRGARLSLGWIEDQNLVCAYHGWSYGPDGVCTRIPSIPIDRGIPRKARLQTYLAEERYGLVWVCLGEPAAGIPDLREAEDSTYRTFIDTHDWRANAARAIENFIDLGHFPWVHPGIVGDRAAPEVPKYRVERQGKELHFEAQMAAPEVKLFSGQIERYLYRVIVPFAAQFIRILPDNTRYLLSFLASPISPRETRRFLLVSRNFALTDDDDTYRQMVRAVAGQDRPIVESQRPEELPLDLTAELHISVPDAASLQYRRMLVEIGLVGPYVA